MEAVILVVHLLLALAIIGLVLLQRSEGGGLGIGGSSGGLGNIATAQGAANALTRATAVCAIAFFATSLTLGILAGHKSQTRQGLLEGVSIEETQDNAVKEAVSEEIKNKNKGNQKGSKDQPLDQEPAVPIAQ